MAPRVAPVALRYAPLLALALVAAGCGKSKERELYEQREAACGTVLGLTVSAARLVLRPQLSEVICPAQLNRIDENDTCGGAPPGPYTEQVCLVRSYWVANDPDLCNNALGCIYGCEARITRGDAAVIDDVVICARSWIP